MTYLIDTNHLSSAVRAVSKIRDRIYLEIGKGNQFGTIVPILCELESGLQNHRSESSLRRHLQGLLRRIRIWPLEPRIAYHYGKIFNDLARRGRVVSQVDMIMIAMARHQDLIILTTDRDFEAVPDVRTENWLI